MEFFVHDVYNGISSSLFCLPCTTNRSNCHLELDYRICTSLDHFGHYLLFSSGQIVGKTVGIEYLLFVVSYIVCNLYTMSF